MAGRKDRNVGRPVSARGLEERTLLSTIQWDAADFPTGGAWDTPDHWIGGVVPTSTDNAEIELSGSGTVSTGATDSVASLMTSASTSVSVNGGSLSLGAATSTIDGPITVSSSGTLVLSGTNLIGTGSVTVAGELTATSTTLGLTSTTLSSGSVLNSISGTVQSGATLSVGANVPVQIAAGQTLTDDGTVNFGSGDAVSFPTVGNATGGETTQIVVNGVLSASGTNFINPGNAPYSLNQIAVNSGGELIANSSTFGLNQLVLANGSVMNPKDLTNDVFNLPISVPFQDVALLGSNQSFQTVNFNGGTLTSGQTLTLVPIGTVSTANLLYVFTSGFTVGSGATMTVATDLSIQIGGGQTLTDDGTVNFDSGVAVSFPTVGNSSGGGTTQVVVNGVLNASGTNFINPGNAPFSLNQIAVNSGGELIASNSTFGLNQLVLANGSVMNPGDLTNDVFNLPISVPYQDVALLGNNKSFQTVNINGATMASGQTLSLVPIGTTSTANLLYVFPSGFTVQSGATLTVASNLSIQIGGGQTLTDDGTVNFRSGVAVSFPTVGNFTGGETTQIVVNGVLNASGTNFINPGNAPYSLNQIAVNSGGELIATGCTFGLNQLILADGSVVNSGDLTNDVFNLPITVPFQDLPLLGNNQNFQTVNINGATMASGETLALVPIGTVSTANLLYVFPSGFTVGSGATLTVATNLSIQIGGGQTLTDDGTVTFASGDAVSFPTTGNSSGGGTTQVVVNGVLNASGTTFINPGNAPFSLNQIAVNSGGELIATSSTFGLNQLNLTAGSTDNLQYVALATELAINSGATINIRSDDFSSASASVVASGDSTATIDLTNNFWGTIDPTTIAAKITDHADNASLPTVLYEPLLSENATATVAASATNIVSPAAQNVALSATVISAAGAASGGTETFTILSGTTAVGNPVTVNVSAGAASAVYVLPAGTAAGTYIIQAVYSGTPDLAGSTDTGHSLTVSVPATASELVIHTPPSSIAAAGQAFPIQPVIYLEDANGNLLTSDNTSMVTVSLASGNGTLQGTKQVTVSGGVATFAGLSDNTAGVISLSFSGDGLTAGPSTNITIKPAVPFQLVIHTQPSVAARAGQPPATGPVVYEEDQYGNIETGDNSTVFTASLASGNGPIRGTTTATLSGGVATFAGLFDNVAGIISLNFAGATFTAGPSNNIFISPGPAAHLVIQTPPYASVTAGNPLTDPIVIDEEDQYGNIETGDNSTVVTASLNSGAGSLDGTKTSTVTAGVASFNDLEDNVAGTLSLKFAAGTLTPVVSSPSTVKAAPATQLVVTSTPPDPIIAGQGFVLVVAAEDQFNNVDTTYTGNVSVSLPTNPRVVATVPVKDGVATFSGLTLPIVGAGRGDPGDRRRPDPSGDQPRPCDPVRGRQHAPAGSDDHRRVGCDAEENEQEGQARRQGCVRGVQTRFQRRHEPVDRGSGHQLSGGCHDHQASQEEDGGRIQTDHSLGCLQPVEKR